MTEFDPNFAVESTSDAKEHLLERATDANGDPGQDLEFVSKMQMRSQETPQHVIDEERGIVATELGLTDHAAIAFDDEGWDSRVYLVNDGETVYKFPRSPEVIEAYGREIAALVMLGTVEGAVATQRFRQLDPGNRYFSYHGLVGTQLSELLPSLPEDEKTRIGGRLGSFLRQLHELELADVPVVTPGDEVAEYQDKYRLALPVIEAELSEKEQQETASLFLEVLPSEMTCLGSEMRLCHGDLGSYNVIVGKDGNVGIIDFGNIGYYDQSKDFIDFWDDTVLNAAFEAYGDSLSLRAKTAIRIAALPAIDIVYYMNKKDSEGVATTVDRLRVVLQGLRNK